jgi:hypothetical protein
MAITNFIPEIWSAAVQQALQEQAVIAPLVSREFEGDARRGNQVNITGVVVPTITDYAGAGRVTSAEDLDDAGDQLPIDQEKSFDFHVDDIDRVQAAGSFEAWTTAAARGLANDADAFLGAAMATEGTTLTTSMSDIGGATNPGNAAHTVIRDANKALNKANIPDGGRVALINAEFEAYLLDADAKLTSADVSGDPSGLRNATIGMYLGFRFVRSNLLPELDLPQAVFFWAPSVPYVSQINQTEGLRSHTKFADRVRGLHVYGAKVMDLPGYADGVQVYTETA